MNLRQIQAGTLPEEILESAAVCFLPAIVLVAVEVEDLLALDAEQARK
jgi:predicted nucleotidyltransferase